jgi:hypothetical protein
MIRRFLPLACAACFGDVAGAQRVDTVVRVAGPPKYPGVATLREEMSIGAVDGADVYTFEKVFDIAVAKDGAVYVLDRPTNVIRVYDAAGKYLRTFGRRGQGPGEIQSPSGMKLLADGRLLVWDTGNARMNVYTPTGANLSPWPVRGSGGNLQWGSLVTDSAGFAYAKSSTAIIIPPERRAPGGPPMDVRSFWFRIRGSDGAVVDTLHEPELPAFPAPFRATSQRGWRQMALPFAAPRIVEMSPLGYFVTGVADRFAFELRVPGRPVVSVRRAVAPTPVSDSERAEHRSRIEDAMREVDPLWTWGGRDLPKVKPFYSEIIVGLDGRIWLTREKATPPLVRAPSTSGRAGAGAAMTEAPDPSFVYRPTLFDVFEPSGAFIGQVQAPPKVSLIVLKGDYVWGVARDDDDVEFVKRYRIIWK